MTVGKNFEAQPNGAGINLQRRWIISKTVGYPSQGVESVIIPEAILVFGTIAAAGGVVQSGIDALRNPQELTTRQVLYAFGRGVRRTVGGELLVEVAAACSAGSPNNTSELGKTPTSLVTFHEDPNFSPTPFDEYLLTLPASIGIFTVAMQQDVGDAFSPVYGAIVQKLGSQYGQILTGIQLQKFGAIRINETGTPTTDANGHILDAISLYQIIGHGYQGAITGGIQIAKDAGQVPPYDLNVAFQVWRELDQTTGSLSTPFAVVETANADNNVPAPK